MRYENERLPLVRIRALLGGLIVYEAALGGLRLTVVRACGEPLLALDATLASLQKRAAFEHTKTWTRTGEYSVWWRMTSRWAVAAGFDPLQCAYDMAEGAIRLVGSPALYVGMYLGWRMF